MGTTEFMRKLIIKGVCYDPRICLPKDIKTCPKIIAEHIQRKFRQSSIQGKGTVLARQSYRNA